MKKRITIKVTQEDLELGKAGDCKYCPVALAATRAMGPEANVVVTLNSLRYTYYSRTNTPHIVLQPLPVAVRNFIKWFDDTGMGRPFSFRLAVEK